MHNRVRAAAVQFEHAPGDKRYNLEIVQRFVEQASIEGVQLIAFPECCLTGYWFLRTLTDEQIADLAEPIPTGSCSRALMELSQRLGMTIGAGLIEKAEDGRLFNAYLIAMPDGSWRRHRKLHTFVHPALASGDEFTVFDTPHGCRVGVLICYDNNLVENARINALMGAEVLFAPHQTGGCASRSPFAMGVVDRALWENRERDPDAIEAEFRGDKGRGWLTRWLPARAHDNGLFLLFSNGVGVDGDEIRTGNAMILDPYGRILTETWKAADAMVIADLDPELQPLSTGRRWLQARRPELYGPLTVPTGVERDIREVRLGEQNAT